MGPAWRRFGEATPSGARDTDNPHIRRYDSTKTAHTRRFTFSHGGLSLSSGTSPLDGNTDLTETGKDEILIGVGAVRCAGPGLSPPHDRRVGPVVERQSIPSALPGAGACRTGSHRRCLNAGIMVYFMD
jgi:hypothetical protein